MELTLRDVVDGENSLLEIGEIEDCDGVTKYRISKTLRILKGPLKDFQDARKVLLEKFGDRKDGEAPVLILGSKPHKKFTKELDKLMDEPVQLEVSKVKMSALLDSHIRLMVQEGDVRKFVSKEITARHLADLDWMLEMDLEDEQEESPKK